MRPPVVVGVVGLGARGRRFAETFDALRDCELRWLCGDGARTPEWSERLTRTTRTRTIDDLLGDETLDAVVITGPLAGRAAQAAAALEAGKHVLVDGPVALSSEETFELAARARENDRCLLAASGLLFDPGLRKLKELVDTNQLGDLMHLRATNRRLGGLEEDADVLWSIGPREIGMILYLLDDVPVAASSWGESLLRPGFTDVVYCFLRFATGITAHVELSWLSPERSRSLTLVGTRRMAAYDGSRREQPLTVYDHAVVPAAANRPDADRIRPGGAASPLLPAEDRMVVECQTFVSAVRRGRPVEAEARHAINVASTLEALQRSIDAGGAAHHVAPPLPQLRNVVAFPGR